MYAPGAARRAVRSVVHALPAAPGSRRAQEPVRAGVGERPHRRPDRPPRRAEPQPCLVLAVPRRGRAPRPSAARTDSWSSPRACAMPAMAMGVSIRPGATALQRTPFEALAWAMLVVRRFTAALVTS